MRGGLVFIILIGSMLILSSCGLTEDRNKADFSTISTFNKVNIIDYPYEDLDAKELESIYEAYKNENKAIALYRKALDLFPKESHFESVIYKQEYQLVLLEDVYSKYELVIPEENWYPKVTEFENPSQACSSAIIFAEQSIDFYDSWLDNDNLNYIVDNQDLRYLYTKLRNDYERTLIPTFKRCARKI